MSSLIGEKIPQFILKDEDGNDFSSDNLLGKYTSFISIQKQTHRDAHSKD